MKEIVSPTGYKVIQLTRLEATAIEFGNICDRCNSITNDDMYYVAAINQLVCHNCYENKISKLPKYLKYKDIETIRFENDNYDKVLTQLEIAQCFSISMFESPL